MHPVLVGRRAPVTAARTGPWCLLLTALAAAGTAVEGAGQVFLTQEEALELAFPDARVERRTAFLGEDQLREAGRLAGPGVELDRGVVVYYVGLRGERPVGVAYFDAHTVRTLDEVVMVAVDPEGAVERVEVLKFAEPPEYAAPEAWIEQLEGQTLSPELSLKGSVINMTGATLTSRALVDATRRVLALHAVVAPFSEPGRELP